MYDVLDIAIYAVNYSHDVGAYINNLKLQKLLYYIQAAFLVEKREICFEDPIVAWKFGPVLPKVYNVYKCYGRDEIPRQDPREVVSFDRRNILLTVRKINMVDQLSLGDKKIIQKVVNAYKNIENPFEMSEKTVSETPWINTKRNESVSLCEMKQYYTKNPEKIYG